ncbi:BCCT family transporter [Secundilactobacillus folii]|uniref:BCCT family transporter n=1 Tax=Secundilactobacillus folii TaxID=2678357 RepID=UPI0012D40E6D
MKTLLGKGATVFWGSIIFTGIFSIWAVVEPKSMTATLWSWLGLYNQTFSWFTMPMPIILLFICLYLALGKFGKVKLGKPEDKPELSTFAWIGTLFTAGIGIGIVNFGVAEPMVHYLQSPQGIAAAGTNPALAAENGFKYSMFIWGLPAWSIYTIAGLVIGYFAYYKGAKFLPGTPIEKGFSDKKWGSSVATVTSIIAAGAASLTIAAHIAIGIFQMQNAYTAITGQKFSRLSDSLVLLLIMFIIYTIAAILPIQKGMGRLGEINTIVAVVLMIFVFALSDAPMIMRLVTENIRHAFLDVIPVGFTTFPFQDQAWFDSWPNTIMIWWISWTPFLGIFIARISKGRTIRQIVFMSILVPTFFLIIWFSVFAGNGFWNAFFGDGKIIHFIANNPENVYLSFIMVLQELPGFQITGIVFLFLVVIFLATATTSSMISISIMTSNGPENAPRNRTILWSIITTMIAFANIVTGTLDGIKAVGVIIGIPFMFFVFLSISGMYRQMQADYKRGDITKE